MQHSRHLYLVISLCFCALFTIQCTVDQPEKSGQHASTQATAATVAKAIPAAPTPVADQPTAVPQPVTATERSASAEQPSTAAPNIPTTATADTATADTATADTATALPTAPVTANHTATAPMPPPTPSATPTPIQPQGPPATHPPTASPPPPTEIAQSAAEAPVIHYFRANVAAAKPGDTVVLEWASSGGGMASLMRTLPSGIVDPNFGTNIEPTGSFVYEIPWHADNGFKPPLTLNVWDIDEPTLRAHQTLEINILCSRDWFFASVPDVCPDELRTSSAAQQRFEHGTMVWVEAFYWADSPTANNRTIYVLFDNDPSTDGTQNYARVFTDEWDESQPEFDPAIAAPNGLYQPVRGFGKVWRDKPEIRARLGWAVGEEEGFVSTMQADTAWRYPRLYLQLADGRVLQFFPTGKTWEVVE